MDRTMTKVIRIGSVAIGGGNPVRIQSMTNTPTEDVEKTVAQILRLEEAGCEIIRSTVPTEEAARAFSEIRKRIHIPLVADIHFNHRLAILAVENGADKVRLNPGNVGGPDKVREVIRACREREVPIRVGVNSGSLEKKYLERDGRVTAEGLADSAMDEVRLIEEAGYDRIVVSLKSSDVRIAVEAAERISERCAYPLHLGITEAGTIRSGTVKSSVGLGLLLSRGLGDTIRVSLTGDPVEEVLVAKDILRAVGLRTEGVEIVSCPTCGRTKIDLIGLANQVEEMVKKYPLGNMKIAVMGCVVNGPGEAREADLGICGGNGEGLLLAKGEILCKVSESELLAALEKELAKRVHL